MQSPEQRRRNTLWARRRRERRQAAALSGHRTCPLRQGKYGVCGGVLLDLVRRDGTVVTVCPRCDRRRKGICQDCNQPVQGRIGLARRCAICKLREKAAAAERFRQRLGPDEVLVRARAAQRRRRADPVRYARMLATKAEWRTKNVVRIKLSKRKWRLDPNRPGGYSSRAKYDAYHTAYRAKHAEHRRELAKRRYYELHPDRPHPICACGCETPIPWDGNGRPAKWIHGHSPWPHALTPKETIMKGIEHAVAVLEKAKEKTQAKLAGVKVLQDELAAIDDALGTLRAAVNGNGAVVPKRGRKARATA